MMQLQFPDRCVTYDQFLHDLAAVMVPQLKAALTETSDVISQRMAYRQFGEGNVRRWLSQGVLTVRKRPGKVEYLLSELRLQQQRTQDYFTK